MKRLSLVKAPIGEPGARDLSPRQKGEGHRCWAMVLFAIAPSTACGLLLGVEAPTFETAGADGGPMTDAHVDDADGALEGDSAISESTDAGSAAYVVPPCPEAGDPSAIFVDAVHGNDGNGTGAAATPLKSITKSLALARLAGAPRTLCIRGGSASSPFVYSEMTTGEVYPIVLDQGNVTLLGEGAAVSVMTAAGDGGAPAAVTKNGNLIEVVSAGITISGLSLRFLNVSGGGLWMGATGALTMAGVIMTGANKRPATVLASAGALALDGVTITGGTTGLAVQGGTADAIRTTISATSGAGITLSGGALSYRSSSVTSTAMTGLIIGCGATLTSVGSSYAKNAVNGVSVHLSDGALSRLSLDGDNLTNNQNDGLFVAPNPGIANPCGLTVQLSGDSLSQNVNNGLSLHGPMTLAVRRSSLSGNGVNGLYIGSDVPAAQIDLGYAADAGENTFQPSSSPNGAAGICLNTTGTISAFGNTFPTCPPSTGATCSGGVAIAIETNDGGINTTGCALP